MNNNWEKELLNRAQVELMVAFLDVRVGLLFLSAQLLQNKFRFVLLPSWTSIYSAFSHLTSVSIAGMRCTKNPLRTPFQYSRFKYGDENLPHRT